MARLKIRAIKMKKDAEQQNVERFADILNSAYSNEQIVLNFRDKYNEWSRKFCSEWEKYAALRSEAIQQLALSRFMRVLVAALLSLCVLETGFSSYKASYITLALTLYLSLILINLISASVICYIGLPGSFLSRVRLHFENVLAMYQILKCRLKNLRTQFSLNTQSTPEIHVAAFCRFNGFNLRNLSTAILSVYNMYGLQVGLTTFALCHFFQYDIFELLETFVLYLLFFIAIGKDTRTFSYIRKIQRRKTLMENITTDFLFWFENESEIKNLLQQYETINCVGAFFPRNSPEISQRAEGLNSAIVISAFHVLTPLKLSKYDFENAIMFLIYERYVKINVIRSSKAQTFKMSDKETPEEKISIEPNSSILSPNRRYKEHLTSTPKAKSTIKPLQVQKDPSRVTNKSSKRISENLGAEKKGSRIPKYTEKESNLATNTKSRDFDENLKLRKELRCCESKGTSDTANLDLYESERRTPNKETVETEHDEVACAECPEDSVDSGCQENNDFSAADALDSVSGKSEFAGNFSEMPLSENLQPNLPNKNPAKETGSNISLYNSKNTSEFIVLPQTDDVEIMSVAGDKENISAFENGEVKTIPTSDEDSVKNKTARALKDEDNQVIQMQIPSKNKQDLQHKTTDEGTFQFSKSKEIDMKKKNISEVDLEKRDCAFDNNVYGLNLNATGLKCKIAFENGEFVNGLSTDNGNFKTYPNNETLIKNTEDDDNANKIDFFENNGDCFYSELQNKRFSSSDKIVEGAVPNEIVQKFDSDLAGEKNETILNELPDSCSMHSVVDSGISSFCQNVESIQSIDELFDESTDIDKETHNWHFDITENNKDVFSDNIATPDSSINPISNLMSPCTADDGTAVTDHFNCGDGTLDISLSNSDGSFCDGNNGCDEKKLIGKIEISSNTSKAFENSNTDIDNGGKYDTQLNASGESDIIFKSNVNSFKDSKYFTSFVNLPGKCQCRTVTSCDNEFKNNSLGPRNCLEICNVGNSYKKDNSINNITEKYWRSTLVFPKTEFWKDVYDDDNLLTSFMNSFEQKTNLNPSSYFPSTMNDKTKLFSKEIISQATYSNMSNPLSSQEICIGGINSEETCEDAVVPLFQQISLTSPKNSNNTEVPHIDNAKSAEKNEIINSINTVTTVQERSKFGDSKSGANSEEPCEDALVSLFQQFSLNTAKNSNNTGVSQINIDNAKSAEENGIINSINTLEKLNAKQGRRRRKAVRRIKPNENSSIHNKTVDSALLADQNQTLAANFNFNFTNSDKDSSNRMDSVQDSFSKSITHSQQMSKSLDKTKPKEAITRDGNVNEVKPKNETEPNKANKVSDLLNFPIDAGDLRASASDCLLSKKVPINSSEEEPNNAGNQLKNSEEHDFRQDKLKLNQFNDRTPCVNQQDANSGFLFRNQSSQTGISLENILNATEEHTRYSLDTNREYISEIPINYQHDKNRDVGQEKYNIISKDNCEQDVLTTKEEIPKNCDADKCTVYSSGHETEVKNSSGTAVDSLLQDGSQEILACSITEDSQACSTVLKTQTSDLFSEISHDTKVDIVSESSTLSNSECIKSLNERKILLAEQHPMNNGSIQSETASSEEYSDPDHSYENKETVHKQGKKNVVAEVNNSNKTLQAENSSLLCPPTDTSHVENSKCDPVRTVENRDCRLQLLFLWKQQDSKTFAMFSPKFRNTVQKKIDYFQKHLRECTKCCIYHLPPTDGNDTPNFVLGSENDMDDQESRCYTPQENKRDMVCAWISHQNGCRHDIQENNKEVTPTPSQFASGIGGKLFLGDFIIPKTPPTGSSEDNNFHFHMSTSASGISLSNSQVKMSDYLQSGFTSDSHLQDFYGTSSTLEPEPSTNISWVVEMNPSEQTGNPPPNRKTSQNSRSFQTEHTDSNCPSIRGKCSRKDKNDNDFQSEVERHNNSDTIRDGLVDIHKELSTKAREADRLKYHLQYENLDLHISDSSSCVTIRLIDDKSDESCRLKSNMYRLGSDSLSSSCEDVFPLDKSCNSCGLSNKKSLNIAEGNLKMSAGRQSSDGINSSSESCDTLASVEIPTENLTSETVESKNGSTSSHEKSGFKHLSTQETILDKQSPNSSVGAIGGTIEGKNQTLKEETPKSNSHDHGARPKTNKTMTSLGESHTDEQHSGESKSLARNLNATAKIGSECDEELETQQQDGPNVEMEQEFSKDFQFETKNVKLSYKPTSGVDAVEVKFRRLQDKTKLTFKSAQKKLYVKMDTGDT